MVSLPSTLTIAAIQRCGPKAAGPRFQQEIAGSIRDHIPLPGASKISRLQIPVKPLDCCCSRPSASQYASERAFAWGSRWLSHRAGTTLTRADLVDGYELIDPATMYGWLSGLLSDAPGTVLDEGTGSSSRPMAR
jgi:hypothetical protein